MITSIQGTLTSANALRAGVQFANASATPNPVVADPGWAYGMLYAVVGPLMLGHATTFHEGAFTVESKIGIVHRTSGAAIINASTDAKVRRDVEPTARRNDFMVPPWDELL